MARFMIGGNAAIFIIGKGRALGSEADALVRRGEIRHGDQASVVASGVHGSFIGEVGNVRAGEANGSPRQRLQFDVIAQGLVLGMDLENLVPSFDVRASLR